MRGNQIRVMIVLIAPKTYVNRVSGLILYSVSMKLVLLSALLVLTNGQPFDWDTVTDLDTYVHSDDGFYDWEVLDSYRYNASCTLYVVNMTSQKWMDESFVDRPYWYHTMGIAVPDTANLTYPDSGFLMISASDNDYDAPIPGEDDGLNALACFFALDTGTVGGYIEQVPNQPLYFANDPSNMRRREDSIIAWTWRTYLDAVTPDTTVIARMPMTKAAKRGLDTVHAVANQYHPETNVTKFLVMGASKRGWTSWSLAATDKRVVAMAPFVFSMLKANETLMVHYQAMGGAWSFAFSPYFNENLTYWLLEEKAKEIYAVEDMWYYRPRYTIPKFQLVSTGDEFFLLQDSHQWWDDIPGPKWTFMLENAEHIMFPHYRELYDTLQSWWLSLLSNTAIPSVTWDMAETADGGVINYYYDTDPEEITVFRAVTLRNDTRRDFRLAAINPDDGEVEGHPVFWSEFNSTLELISPGHYRAETKKVDDEWVGMVVRAMWRGPSDRRMYFTSETLVIPDTFPVGPCADPNSCYGSLV